MLGMGAHQRAGRTEIEQQTYVVDILEESAYMNAKPSNTPWDTYIPTDDELLEKAQAEIYRRIVGQLMYLSTVIRQNITFTVDRLAPRFRKPTKGLWERPTRALRYLNGPRNGYVK